MPIILFLEKKESNAPFGQDKGTPRRTDIGSPEPSYPPQMAHSSPKHHGSQKRQLREVSGCVTDAVFQRLEILRNAGKDNEVSRSSLVGKFVTHGVLQTADTQYISLLEPIIRSIIRSEFRAFTDRFIAIIARIAYWVRQILFVQLNLLALTFADDEKTLRDIEAESEKSARVHIGRRTPQIDEVIARVKQLVQGQS